MITGYRAEVGLALVGRPLQSLVADRLRPKSDAIVTAFVDHVWSMPETRFEHDAHPDPSQCPVQLRTARTICQRSRSAATPSASARRTGRSLVRVIVEHVGHSRSRRPNVPRKFLRRLVTGWSPTGFPTCRSHHRNPSKPLRHKSLLVGTTGLEPGTSTVSWWRSNQLSYAPAATESDPDPGRLRSIQRPDPSSHCRRSRPNVRGLGPPPMTSTSPRARTFALAPQALGGLPFQSRRRADFTRADSVGRPGSRILGRVVSGRGRANRARRTPRAVNWARHRRLRQWRGTIVGSRML